MSITRLDYGGSLYSLFENIFFKAKTFSVSVTLDGLVVVYAHFCIFLRKLLPSVLTCCKQMQRRQLIVCITAFTRKMRIYNLCRICLVEDTTDKKMQPLFDNRNKLCGDIVRKIEECSGVKVTPVEEFPKMICADCLDSLNTCCKFRALCQASESALLNAIVKSELNVEIKEAATIRRPGSQTTELVFPEFINTSAVDFDEATNQMKDSDAIRVSGKSESDDDKEFISEMESSGAEEDQEFLSVKAKKSKVRKAKAKANGNAKLIKTKKGKYQRTRARDAVPSAVDTPKKVLPNRGRKKLTEAPASIICEICGNIYAKRSLLSMHMRRHAAKKPFDCEICGKTFACPSEISRHIRIHTGEKPYVCKYCGRRFNDRSTNIKHERIHTNERPFKCKTCGKSFSYSNVLKNHMLTHTGEKPFLCAPCNKTFSRKHQLDQHLSTLTHQQTVKNLNSVILDVKSELPNIISTESNSFLKAASTTNALENATLLMAPTQL